MLYIKTGAQPLSLKDSDIFALSQTRVPTHAESLGRFILPNIGYVDVTDEDTLEVAKSYLKILEKKLKARKDGKIAVLETFTPDVTME